MQEHAIPKRKRPVAVGRPSAVVGRSDALPSEWEIARLRAVLHDHLPELRERFKVSQLWAFGSYVRNEQQPTSDLDVLVEFSETPSLFTFIDLQDSLRDLLGLRVDLVMREALKPRIRERVERTKVAV